MRHNVGLGDYLNETNTDLNLSNSYRDDMNPLLFNSVNRLVVSLYVRMQ